VDSARHRGHLQRVEPGSACRGQPRKDRTTTDNDDDGFERLLQHIRDDRGFDFTGYEPTSLARRVRRRMGVLGLSRYDEYLDHLLLHPEEFTQLFDTILVNHTSFFRDPEAWAHLQRELLPPLLRRREGQPIRIWSAGCASGEEACTMALVLAEAIGVDDVGERVTIYATDVDEEALAQARQATYTRRDLDSVPSALREKYFETSTNRFVLRDELRRSLAFGRNDLVHDAPISHVDVLLCRNTLMYFDAETQERILSRLHFALRPDGILFLGGAEMLLGSATFFRPVGIDQRFFLRIAQEDRDRRVLGQAPEPGPDAAEQARVGRIRQAALMSSAAALLVLDEQGHLVVCNHTAMSLLGLSQGDLGESVQGLEVFSHPLELGAHIEEAITRCRPVWVRDVELIRGAAERIVLDVELVPLVDEVGTALGVTLVFNDVTQHRQLQDELLYASRQLETAYAELQSTNEELATTNKELQSMNDELHSSHQALRERQDDVDRLNRFMTSVLGSMSSGVVVVDSRLTVLAWNARAEDLWGIRTDEALGAHLMNLDFGLPVDQLRQPIRSQLRGTDPDPRTLVLDAVDRHGRAVQVRITLTKLHDQGSATPAAVIAMEATASGEA
jgi:two-component system, chemotaxis family, CheB/CheR fusion protein